MVASIQDIINHAIVHHTMQLFYCGLSISDNQLGYVLCNRAGIGAPCVFNIVWCA